MTKGEVTKALKALQGVGWKVYTFNNFRAMPTGSIGFPDHVLAHPAKKKLIFIEVKIGKDKLSMEQAETLTTLAACCEGTNHEVMIFPGKCKTISELQEYIFNS